MEEQKKPFLKIPSWIWLVGLAATLSLGGYILISQGTYRIGFPLDDAWIHQTYARNLGLTFEWAYLPGKPSGGSTSPLWTLLLSIGYLGRIPYLLWTFLLEGILLWMIGCVAEATFRSIFSIRSRIPWVGFFFVLEWHLAWSAGSGMETLLFCLAGISLFALLTRSSKNWFLLGLLVGVSTWIRPDGITLIGPVALVAWVASKDMPSRVKSLFMAAGGLTCAFGPYLIFNRVLAGSWWPNTFYAKQVEYAALQQIPYLQRLLSEMVLPIIGAGSLLIPGAGIYLWYAIHNRKWAVIAGYLWIIGYIALYAWRLPVTYQHGRYILPVMPVFFLFGILGYRQFLETLQQARWRWVLGQAWKIALPTVLVAFWVIGGQSYGRDVAVIESEMVDAAQWISINTQPGSLIAAHDIGALGYFGNRDILDLAGLISPEVIPILRDERTLKFILNEKAVDYLMTFPDWYQTLTEGKTILYQGNADFAPDLGQANMCVYQWRSAHR